MRDSGWRDRTWCDWRCAARAAFAQGQRLRLSNESDKLAAKGTPILSVARTHGINVNREWAEVFQVYRVVA